MVATVRERLLRAEGCIFNRRGDVKAWKLQEVGEEFVAMAGTAGRPASLEQKRRADGDLALLDQSRNLGTAIRGQPG